MSAVKQVILNDKWAAVLSAGKCMLHPIEMEEKLEDQVHNYPQTKNEAKIRQIGLTKEFLILLDVKGKIKYYNL